MGSEICGELPEFFFRTNLDFGMVNSLDGWCRLVQRVQQRYRYGTAEAVGYVLGGRVAARRSPRGCSSPVQCLSTEFGGWVPSFGYESAHSGDKTLREWLADAGRLDEAVAAVLPNQVVS